MTEAERLLNKNSLYKLETVLNKQRLEQFVSEPFINNDLILNTKEVAAESGTPIQINTPSFSEINNSEASLVKNAPEKFEFENFSSSETVPNPEISVEEIINNDFYQENLINVKIPDLEIEDVEVNNKNISSLRSLKKDKKEQRPAVIKIPEKTINNKIIKGRTIDSIQYLKAPKIKTPVTSLKDPQAETDKKAEKTVQGEFRKFITPGVISAAGADAQIRFEEKLREPVIKNTQIINSQDSSGDAEVAEDTEISGRSFPAQNKFFRGKSLKELPAEISNTETAGDLTPAKPGIKDTQIINSQTAGSTSQALIQTPLDLPASTTALNDTKLSDTNGYLSSLIQNSADAFNNMFDVEINFGGEETYSLSKCRITNFTAPKREVLTEEIPFENISVKKILASSSIDHQQTYNIRVDEDYLIWTELKNRMCINEKGDFNIYDADLERNEATITVTAYKFATSAIPKAVRKWTFYNARVTNIADITYAYNASQGISGNITFIYSYFDETSLS